MCALEKLKHFELFCCCAETGTDTPHDVAFRSTSLDRWKAIESYDHARGVCFGVLPGRGYAEGLQGLGFERCSVVHSW